MNNKKKGKDIENEATSLLKKVFGDINTIKLPINISRIVYSLKIKMFEGEFKDKNIEAALSRVECKIYLSINDDIGHKNFAIAHELGHLLLHKDRSTDIFTMEQLERLDGCNIDKDSEDPEDQADYFALCLLMPTQLVKSLWMTTKDFRILAKIFDVPEFIVQCRVKTLNIDK